MRHVQKFGNKKNYYTPMILNVFMVCVKIFSQLLLPKHLDGTMAEYLDKLHALLHDFNELLPPAPSPSQELE